jgi:hypothetical protein
VFRVHAEKVDALPPLLPVFPIVAGESGSVASVSEAVAGCAAEDMSIQENVESSCHLELIVKVPF